MTRPIIALTCASLWTAAVTNPASAQQRVRLSGGPTLAHMRVHSEDAVPPVNEALSAAEVGFEATMALRRLLLRIRYAQANLSSPEPPALARDAVEGELALTAQVRPWLRVGTDLRRRSYDSELRRQRWTMWDALAAAELPIFEDALMGFGELRATLAASVDEAGADPWNRGYGGDVGMRLGLPRIPVWLRLSYRLEVQKLSSGARREVVDGITVFLGLGRPR